MRSLLFRDKGRVSHPQKQSPKGEDDSRVLTSTKENESYRTTEEQGVEQPPTDQERATPDCSWPGGGDGVRLECVVCRTCAGTAFQPPIVLLTPHFPASALLRKPIHNITVS